MPKRPRYSRWGRLPGVFRSGEHKLPSPADDQQRLTLFLPGKLLDRAQELARLAGYTSTQAYCEHLLRQAIEFEAASHKLEQTEAERGPLEGLREVASDPDYLAEWTASRSPRDAMPAPEPDAMSPFGPGPSLPESEPAAALQAVLRHAGLPPEDATALIPRLRRGEPIQADQAQELLRALLTLESALRSEAQIDRRLAFALHRLAFEGQILVGEAWPGLMDDAATVDALRLIQEAVDRVLSGEDIRYFDREADAQDAAD